MARSPAVHQARKNLLRTIAVSGLVVAGTVHAVRTAIVNGLLNSRPDVAAKVWPGHPRVKLALAMADIGASTAARRLPPESTFDIAKAAANDAPLAVEPLLISGAWAQINRRQGLAEALFVEASRRDPRSSAARYFLAQRYLSTARPAEGLQQALVLVRLVSGGSAALAPALAQYAKSPGAIPVLKKLLASDAEMQDLVLGQLSNDGKNYSTIMSLAGNELGLGSTDPVPQWQLQLLRKLIEGGDLTRARALWLRISGLTSDPRGIFNPRFLELHAPPPFNWTVRTGEYGSAEPAGKEGLRVVYSGLGSTEFANQTMLLTPGNYRLSMQVTRDPASEGQSGLSWLISCMTGGKSLLNLSLSTQPGTSKTISGKFTVPATCRSQSIGLSAIPIQFGSSEQVTIKQLQVVNDVP
jgi:hypothetical protein